MYGVLLTVCLPVATQALYEVNAWIWRSLVNSLPASSCLGPVWVNHAMPGGWSRCNWLNPDLGPNPYLPTIAILKSMDSIFMVYQWTAYRKCIFFSHVWVKFEIMKILKFSDLEISYVEQTVKHASPWADLNPYCMRSFGWQHNISLVAEPTIMKVEAKCQFGTQDGVIGQVLSLYVYGCSLHTHRVRPLYLRKQMLTLPHYTILSSELALRLYSWRVR